MAWVSIEWRLGLTGNIVISQGSFCPRWSQKKKHFLSPRFFFFNPPKKVCPILFQLVPREDAPPFFFAKQTVLPPVTTGPSLGLLDFRSVSFHGISP